MVSLIEEARNAESGRPREALELMVLDFGGLTDALSTARLMGPIPDPKTQSAWAAAIEHLDGAVREVLASVPKDGRTIQSLQETGQMLPGVVHVRRRDQEPQVSAGAAEPEVRPEAVGGPVGGGGVILRPFASTSGGREEAQPSVPAL
ncbi:hypothetical protein SMICM304S_07080 [Streptomyces microflavus]